jgi:type IV pilus assembly protein PilV
MIYAIREYGTNMSKTTGKHPNGFTLIEVLITVLILSIGLLGLAGLQVSSMKSNHSSYLRSQATILAYDIIDRMRANPNAVTATVTNYVNKAAATPSAVAACTSVAGTCTVANMADTDVNEWRAALAAQLPGGVGVICLDQADQDDGTGPGPNAADHGCDDLGTVYAIKIWWTDERDNAGTLKRFVTSYAP